MEQFLHVTRSKKLNKIAEMLKLSLKLDVI